jgi:hypothetical protein
MARRWLPTSAAQRLLSQGVNWSSAPSAVSQPLTKRTVADFGSRPARDVREIGPRFRFAD